MNNNDLSKVLRFIEENIRISEQTTIEYLDPKGHIERLNSKQNQVVFGRRGSGKSLLLKSLKSTDLEKKLYITINIEDFKDISFPNSISQVLISVIKKFKKEIDGKYNIFSYSKWKKQKELIKKIDNYISDLNTKISEPDTYNQNIKEKQASKLSGEASSGFHKSSAKISSELADEYENSREILKDKLNELKNEISNFKELIEETTSFLNKDIFLIFDEVQSGFGRTGKWAAYEHYGVTPDLSTWAKSMGGGMPIGAVIGKQEIMDAVKPGLIGGTYLGNPLSCVASLASIKYMQKNNINAAGDKVGRIVRDRFNQLQEKFPKNITDVRGLGAMLAIEFFNPETKMPDGDVAKAIVNKCLEKGLIVITSGTYGNCIRILSPLFIEDKILEKGLSILEETIKEILS